MKQNRLTDWFDELNCNSKSVNFPLDFYGPQCNKCGGDKIIKKDKRKTKYKGKKRIFECKDCGKKFDDDLTHGSRYPLWVWCHILDRHVKGICFNDIIKDIKTESEKKNIRIKITKPTIADIIKRCAKKLSILEFEFKHTNRAVEWQIDDAYQKLINKRFGYINNVLAVETRYWLAGYVSTKRDMQSTVNALKLSAMRAGYHPVEIKCDGFQAYKNGIKKALAHVQVKSKSKGKEYSWINYVERLNRTMRDLAVKKNKCYRSVEFLGASVEINRLYYNFLRKHKSLDGKTPAVAAGISYPFKSWEDLLKFAHRLQRKSLIKNKKTKQTSFKDYWNF